MISNNILMTDQIPTRIANESNFTVHKPDNGTLKYKELDSIVHSAFENQKTVNEFPWRL